MTTPSPERTRKGNPMRTRAEQEALMGTLKECADDGDVVAFSIPGTEMQMICERRMIEQAMDAWNSKSREYRRNSMASIRRAMKAAQQAITGGIADDKTMDAYAADCVLYLAHELIYGEGEKLLVKPPAPSSIQMPTGPH